MDKSSEWKSATGSCFSQQVAYVPLITPCCFLKFLQHFSISFFAEFYKNNSFS